MICIYITYNYCTSINIKLFKMLLVPYFIYSYFIYLWLYLIQALSWCPWRPSLLATGGGSADKAICLWNACSGQLEDKVDTGSQVQPMYFSSFIDSLDQFKLTC